MWSFIAPDTSSGIVTYLNISDELLVCFVVRRVQTFTKRYVQFSGVGECQDSRTDPKLKKSPGHFCPAIPSGGFTFLRLQKILRRLFNSPWSSNPSFF